MGLGLIAAFFLAGWTLTPSGAAGTGPLRLFDVPLPAICWFRLTTGFPCAGCGLTRSFVLLTHGRIAESIALHPFGIVFAALLVTQIPPLLLQALGAGGGWIGLWNRLWVAALALAFGAMFVWWVFHVPILSVLRALL